MDSTHTQQGDATLARGDVALFNQPREEIRTHDAALRMAGKEDGVGLRQIMHPLLPTEQSCKRLVRTVLYGPVRTQRHHRNRLGVELHPIDGPKVSHDGIAHLHGKLDTGSRRLAHEPAGPRLRKPSMQGDDAHAPDPFAAALLCASALAHRLPCSRQTEGRFLR